MLLVLVGLPRPRNLDVALEGEHIARDHGAVPATIGVFHGQSVVGLSAEEITELSRTDDLLKHRCASSPKPTSTA